MNVFSRVGRIVKGWVNAVLGNLEDPEQQLDVAVQDMQEKQVQFRQAVAKAMATQKRLEGQYSDSVKEEQVWTERAKLAVAKIKEAQSKGRDTEQLQSLAKRALEQKKIATQNKLSMTTQLENYKGQVGTLKKQLSQLEGKIAAAKQDKTMLKARNQAAEAQLEVQALVGGIDTTSATAAYDQMREKVLNKEAEAQAQLELSGSTIENQFAELESGSDIDDELALMLAGDDTAPAALPEAEAKSIELDPELEQLKAELDQ